ncbi:MAG: MmcQ/YjbR family DNA-binding protein [Microthrixaceae bacterium]
MGSDTSRAEVTAALEEVRAVCSALPGVTERLSHGSPTFFVKKSFCMFQDDHHGDGRLALWCAAPEGAQGLMVDTEPDRFFVPPYVGHRGWLGYRLDIDPDPDELAAVLTDAWRCVAPARLLAEFDAAAGDG